MANKEEKEGVSAHAAANAPGTTVAETEVGKGQPVESAKGVKPVETDKVTSRQEQEDRLRELGVVADDVKETK